MKYAIYGLPCVGKDYLISQLSEHLAVKHLRGSEYLNSKSNGKFRELPTNEQKKLRQAFIPYVNSFSTDTDIVVDGHYCFIENGNYNVVFTEEDGACYDVFFYLSAPAATIRERIRASEKNKKYRNLSDEELNQWKEYEIQNLQKECFEREKEFIILNGDFDSNLAFISKVITKEIPLSVSVAREITQRILAGCHGMDVCLIDCDKTISNNDSTDLIFVDKHQDIRKALFCGDCYTLYQIYSMNTVYASITSLDDRVEYSIDNTEVNTDLVSDLKQLRKTLFVGLSCGLLEIWDGISKKYAFPNLVFGNSIRSRYMITDAVKGYIAKDLRQNGKKVIGIGDSVADYLMLLNSDYGYVISHNKINKSLQRLLLDCPVRTIKQPESNGIIFENVSVVRSIHEDIN